MKTPKNQKSQANGVEQEKSSGKKLVQARLPFKILSTPTSETAEGVAAGKSVQESTEARKRKLSYNDQEDNAKHVIEQSSKRRSTRSGMNTISAEKQKEIPNESVKKAADVVVLSDSDNGPEHDNSGCKENVKTIAKTKLIANREESSDVHSDDVELIESTDEEEKKVVEKEVVKAVIKTPASGKTLKNKAATKTPTLDKKSSGKSTRKSATPQSGNKAAAGKGRKSSEDTTPGSKLQIKLPIGGKKNKRRKQAEKAIQAANEHDMQDETSDDIEVISDELHPQKRPKMDVPDDSEVKTDINEKKETANEEKAEDDIVGITEKESEVAEIKPLDNELDEKVLTEENVKKTEETQSENSVKSQPEQPENSKESTPVDSEKNSLESEDIASEAELDKSKKHDVSSATSDLEASTETETTVNSERPQRNTVQKTGKDNDTTAAPKLTGDSSAQKLQKKNLTPKQQKLIEQRLKAREEKERKIQEERLQKQREKEERELAKKREREEKEELRRREREEKEEQRRKEREEKERKRLAEIEAKNEEKRKRNEAKEEEQRKKEEERKRKEQEKEEAEMKKKKAAMAFTKFFSRPTQDSTGQRTGENIGTEEDHELLAFRPFQVKGDMQLAPIVRKRLTDDAREQLVTFLEAKEHRQIEGEMSTKLYLDELKNGLIKPCKWCPPTQPIESKQENNNEEDDVLIVEDELERAGQAIVEEHIVPIERFRAKFYKFNENRRPPYFGTWRKKSRVITPRRPFAQDKQFFDYEIDSDDEWEEEEPGESLDGSDEDKEKESEDEDYEVDNEWFVPHGHLSEEEMQNEDDLGENNDREAQKAKLQILQQEFAQEMKKKTEKIKPRLIGCIWVDENGNQPELCPKIIWDTLNVRAILCAEPPIMEEIKTNMEKHSEANTEKGLNGEKGNGEIKLKPIILTETMLKQLVKLVHGNTHSKNFLIKEFIAYIEANEESVRNGDVRGPLKSAVREKIDEYAQWQAIEITSNNNESNKDASKTAKTPKTKKKLCWVVTNDILQKMNLETIDLNNNWDYILQPRIRSKATQKEDPPVPIVIAIGEDSNENSETSVDRCNVASGNATDPSTPVHAKSNRKPDIKKFTKVLTAEEKAQQLQKQTDQLKISSTKEIAASSPTSNKSTPKSNKRTSSSANQTPTVKKRVPLLISVARGQSISTPDKNARISQFLKTINDAKQKEKNVEIPTPMETDDIVVLE